LIKLARAQGDPDLRDGAAVLEAWDKQINAESRGAVLYMAWFGQYFQSTASPFKRPWSPADLAHTPSGLADPAGALAAFGRAVAAVKQAYNSLDIAWGETHRLRRGDLDLPLRGTGLTFNSIMYRPALQNIFLGTGGDSYVLAVEFMPTGPKAYSVTAYSETSNPQSPHFNDQTRLYAAQQYKTAWFAESDVKANTVKEYRPIR
jgi:acyl-homoserine-lactone acylase